MAVLVTRPDTPGLDLYHQLNKQGITALHHPLTRFKAGSGLNQLVPLLAESDVVIAVSQQAVKYSQQYLNQHRHQWPSDTRYLAIGQKTAQLLSNFTQQTVNYPQISDSEHFIALSELQDISGIYIVILRGNGGRELIAQQLTDQGAQVRYCEVYQREMLPFNAQIMVPQWQQAAVDQIVITSEAQLNFFVSQISEYDYPWLLNQRLLVPSDRIAKIAHEQGFKNIVAVGSAKNSELIAALQPQKE